MASLAVPAASVDILKDMFPSLSVTRARTVLSQCKNDVEAAAALLLDDPSLADAPAASIQTQPSPRSGPVHKVKGKSGQRSMTWNDISQQQMSTADKQRDPLSGRLPQFIGSGYKAAAGEFPGLAQPPASSAATPQPLHTRPPPPPRLQHSTPSFGGQHASSSSSSSSSHHGHQHGYTARRGGPGGRSGGWGPSSAVHQQSHQQGAMHRQHHHQESSFAGLLKQQPPSSAAPRHAAAPVGPSDWRDDVAQQLVQQHQWASLDLIKAVLESVSYDITEAEAICADMVALSEEQQIPEQQEQGAAGSRPGSGQGSPAGPGHQRSSSLSPRPTSSTHTPSSPASATHHHHHQQQQQSPQHHHQHSPQQQQQPQQQPQRSPQQQAGTEDVYLKHRRQALRLTGSWQKLMRRSLAAYEAGAHSEGHRLMSEARRVRAQADAAHAEAATKIEAEVNAGNPQGLWQLDVHGLHVTEAIEAVEKRLALLEYRPRDAGIAARVLRVVVGRGLHSAGGEASVPRNVERYLMEQGYKYHWRQGAIDVRVRQPYALLPRPEAR